MPQPSDNDYEPPSTRPATQGQAQQIQLLATDASVAAGEARDAAIQAARHSSTLVENMGIHFWLLFGIGLVNAALLLVLILRA